MIYAQMKIIKQTSHKHRINFKKMFKIYKSANQLFYVHVSLCVCVYFFFHHSLSAYNNNTYTSRVDYDFVRCASQYIHWRDCEPAYILWCNAHNHFPLEKSSVVCECEWSRKSSTNNAINGKSMSKQRYSYYMKNELEIPDLNLINSIKNYGIPIIL